MLFGAYIALFQHDLKGLLAYSTISHLGLITLLFGLDTPLAAVAAVFHILNHAMFKASLFMAAGIIDHETGTRDMRRLDGLWQFMPITATLAMVAAAAMAGVPLLNGFLSKEMFFAETLTGRAARLVDWLRAGRGHAGRRRSRVAYSHALRPRRVLQRRAAWTCRATPHEPPRWMRVPVESWSCSACWSGVAARADRRTRAGGDAAQAPCCGGRCRSTAWRCGTGSTCRC